MARYSRVGAARMKSDTFRYTVDRQGNLTCTEMDIAESQVSICFKDSQKLESICDKLSRCSVVIDSSLEIGRGCLEFCQSLNTPSNIQAASADKLRLYVRRMMMHARATSLLIRQSEKTAQTVRTPSLPRHRSVNNPSYPRSCTRRTMKRQSKVVMRCKIC